jgi:hypothetical protein
LEVRCPVSDLLGSHPLTSRRGWPGGHGTDQARLRKLAAGRYWSEADGRAALAGFEASGLTRAADAEVIGGKVYGVAELCRTYQGGRNPQHVPSARHVGGIASGGGHQHASRPQPTSW